MVFFSTNSDFKYESSDEEESKNPRSIQNIDLLFKFSGKDVNSKMDTDDFWNNIWFILNLIKFEI